MILLNYVHDFIYASSNWELRERATTDCLLGYPSNVPNGMNQHVLEHIGEK